jgi:peptidoglycan/xylan/chitin deacetylase (PgdA/CDA1 family)/glycosyltransferase involved in cell wall biosynthesis
MLNQFFQILSRGKLTILLFHKIPESKHPLMPFEMDLKEFERTLLMVTKVLRIIPLDAALQSLKAGNLPARAASITFDDGYRGWLNGVVPILERLQIHATFFITTGQLNGDPIWNERLLYTFTHAPEDTEDLALPATTLPVLSFSNHLNKMAALNDFEQFLKYQSQENRQAYISALDAHTGINSLLAPSMTSEAVRELHSRGFDIGGHGVHHPILTKCTPEQAYDEIAGSKEMLESVINAKVKFFAYPNGIPELDFNCDHIEMVARAGYDAALTTQKGFGSEKTMPFQVPRFTPWGPSLHHMKLQLARNFMQNARELKEARVKGKRALLVAFHFPPQAGSSGILRTLNFVKYLPSHQWNISVLTATPRAFTQQSNDLIDAVPVRTRVIRALALDASRHLAVKGRYLRIAALPDRWSSWWLPAVFKGMKEIRKECPDVIWSTYPIATAHLIGATLARLTGLPWVADFRDPMNSTGYSQHIAQRWLWQRLESYVIETAKVCVFTNVGASESYRKRYPKYADKYRVIENGYDEELFARSLPSREGAPPHKLLILHSGLIYPKDRNPSTFFAALRILINNGDLDINNLCVRFRAPHHDEEVMASALQHGLGKCVEIKPPVFYQQAIAEMMGADMLLVFQGSGFNSQIPAKIYEYLRAGRPIFAVVDPVGGTAIQLARFGAVQIADIASETVICEALMLALNALETEKQRADLAKNILQLTQYSRQFQAALLDKIFNEILTLKRQSH